MTGKYLFFEYDPKVLPTDHISTRETFGYTIALKGGDMYIATQFLLYSVLFAHSILVNILMNNLLFAYNNKSHDIL